MSLQTLHIANDGTACQVQLPELPANHQMTARQVVLWIWGHVCSQRSGSPCRRLMLDEDFNPSQHIPHRSCASLH